MTPIRFGQQALAKYATAGVDCRKSMKSHEAETDVTSPYRRSNYDVTDTVQVSSPGSVRAAVRTLYATTWPGPAARAGVPIAAASAA